MRGGGGGENACYGCLPSCSSLCLFITLYPSLRPRRSLFSSFFPSISSLSFFLSYVLSFFQTTSFYVFFLLSFFLFLMSVSLHPSFKLCPFSSSFTHPFIPSFLLSPFILSFIISCFITGRCGAAFFSVESLRERQDAAHGHGEPGHAWTGSTGRVRRPGRKK